MFLNMKPDLIILSVNVCVVIVPECMLIFVFPFPCWNDNL